MIFVTVGTMPFPRLVEAMDRYAAQTDERVVLQTASQEYKPTHAEHRPYVADLAQWLSEARLVVCHAGVGTVSQTIEYQKPFVCMPRDPKFAEHFDDHQLQFVQRAGETLPGVTIADAQALPQAIEHAPARRETVVYSSTRAQLIAAIKVSLNELCQPKA